MTTTTEETAMTTVVERLAELAELPAPGTTPGWVERRQVSRGLRVLAVEQAGELGAWQAGAMALVEESWRRRERTPFGDRWPERSQRYLLIEEPRAGGTVVHRHPVPATVRGVRGALAWCLRLRPEQLELIARCQGDVYVLARGAGLRSQPLPARHDVGPEGTLVHPVHAPIAAPGPGEVVRCCRRAAVRSRYAGGGTSD